MKKPLLALAALLPFSQPALAVDKYDFDRSHTSILFFIKHQGLSFVQGEFHDYEGNFWFDPASPGDSFAEVTIRTDSIDTDHGPLNAHLKNADFFNVEAFPTMVFRSTRLEVTGDNTGQLTGDLTLLGQTHPVTLDVTFNGALDRNDRHKVGFSATGRLNRSDWGMGYGIPNVADEVDIRIETEGQRVAQEGGE